MVVLNVLHRMYLFLFQSSLSNRGDRENLIPFNQAFLLDMNLLYQSLRLVVVLPFLLSSIYGYFYLYFCIQRLIGRWFLTFYQRSEYVSLGGIHLLADCIPFIYSLKKIQPDLMQLIVWRRILAPPKILVLTFVLYHYDRDLVRFYLRKGNWLLIWNLATTGVYSAQWEQSTSHQGRPHLLHHHCLLHSQIVYSIYHSPPVNSTTTQGTNHIFMN